MKNPQRLLVIAHGHPRWSIGGGENAAYAMHRAFASRSGWMSVFLAAAPTGMDHTSQDFPLCWPLKTPQEWLMRRSEDWLLLRRSMQAAELRWLRDWCEALQPDVIHVHHLVGIGIDVLLAMRQWLPQTRIVFTLHEYLLLCPLRGQFLRLGGERCSQARIEDCSRCLPQISPARLWLRNQWMNTLEGAVDHWIAPSNTLRKQFLRHGWEPTKISTIENLLTSEISTHTAKQETNTKTSTTQFGYFGTPSYSKGLDIILKAFLLAVREQPNLKLEIHGPNPLKESTYDNQEDKEFRYLLSDLIEKLGDTVSLKGPYHQSSVPELMANIDWIIMASRWIENSPVVIQEAKTCKTPILVPKLGGMAEKVRHEVDGLHYPPDDPKELTKTIIRCSQKQAGNLTRKTKAGSPDERDDLISKHELVYQHRAKI